MRISPACGQTAHIHLNKGTFRREMKMAVYVYSTGSVLKKHHSSARISVTINNRNCDTQQYRVILWDTSANQNPKVQIASTGLVNIDPNDTDLVFFDNPLELKQATRFEVEIRLSNQHMAPYVELHYHPNFWKHDEKITQRVFAGEMFTDSDQNSDVGE
jgi:methionine salvage enolase-phosphatase E1